MNLFAAQTALIDGIVASLGTGPLRHTIVASTGCGKTAMAIRTAQILGARRILVLCPAIVRYHWAAEFARWGDRVDVGVIEMGRARKSGTKRMLLARDWAYAQPIQIVSYDLVKEIDVGLDWDMLIIDELHNLGEALSKQSRLIRSFVGRFPNLHILGLTATPIPTNPVQVWYPQWLMHGSESWGKPRPSGGLSYEFARKYFEIYRNEYTQFGVGRLREDRRDELHQAMARAASFLTRADISADLPPLDVRPLYINKLEHTTYMDWLDGLGEDIDHAVILTYHREEAARVFDDVSTRRRAFYIDGSVPTGSRQHILDTCAANPSCVLVATQESLSEGVRLMWAQKVLITEFRRSPGQVTQLLGRFQSVGDPRKPMVEIAIDDDSDAMADLLLSRVADINAVLSVSNVPAVVEEVFAPRELTDEKLADLFGTMVSSFNDAVSEWEAGEDTQENT